MNRRIAALLALALAVPALAAPPAAPSPYINPRLGIQTPPSGFAWNFASHPVNIYRAPSGKYSTDLDPRAATPAIKAIFDGISTGATGVVYADAAAANNTSSALTSALARQSIRQALAVCEADGTKTNCAVYVKAGDYDRTRDFNATNGTAVYPSKPTALVCYGGTCINSPTVKGLSWTANGSAWQATRSSTGHILNETAFDTYGDRNDFALQTSVANVQACVATDCYYTDGTTLTIKRADGATPTDVNTRVLLQATGVDLGSSTANAFYMSGFTVLGGLSATIRDNATTAHTRDLVLEDVYAAYPSNATGNTVGIDNLTGFVGFWRVQSDKSGADSFNPHETLNTGNMDFLLVDPVSKDVGRNGSVSNNCLTSHDGGSSAPYSPIIRLIVLNGTCLNNSGGSVRPVQGSQIWIMGYAVDTDRGDLQFSGNEASTCMQADDNAVIWAQDVRCTRTLYSVAAGTNAKIYIRRFDDGGGQRVGNGTISPF